MSYLGESVGGGRATVRTTVLGRNGRDLPLEYRMVERGDRWAVYDLVIDGVSLAPNYRAQFTRVIQSSSYPELVQQLRDKVAAPLPAVIASAESLVPELAVPTTPPGESAIKPTPPQTMASASPVTEVSRPRSSWVQVAAFKSFGAAIRLASHLRREKSVAPDRWAVVMEPGPALARVRVGPFADRAEATSNLRELASRGFKPFIAEESGDPR